MSETTSTTGTAPAPVADNTKPLASEPKGRTGAARILAGRDAITIYALIAFLIYAAITIPRFASPVTTGFLLLDVIPVLLIAMPMTLIIITGEIDLSVASIAGLTSALMGVLWAGGMDIWLVLAISLLAGIAAGMFNGFLIAVLGLPSLAVTIGTLALFRGLALVTIGDNAVANFPKALTAFFTSKLGGTGIPTVMIGVVARHCLLRGPAALHAVRPRALRHRLQQGGRQLRGHQGGPQQVLALRGIRCRLRPGRDLLDAALHQRPQRQRVRTGTGRHRRCPARRRLDLRRQGIHSRRHRRCPADRHASTTPSAWPACPTSSSSP